MVYGNLSAFDVRDCIAPLALIDKVGATALAHANHDAHLARPPAELYFGFTPTATNTEDFSSISRILSIQDHLYF